MNPSTYGELKAVCQQYAHRTDLAGVIGDLIHRASERIGRRFGVMPTELVNENDTNSTLTSHPGLYIYATMREIAIYTADAEATEHYEALYQREVEQMNINYHGADWDNCDPPAMCPETHCCD